MRFRINKHQEERAYSIVVSGEVNDDSSWDLLMIAQAMLSMPSCQELIIDLRGATIDDDVSGLNTDTLVSVFEEGLLLKNRMLTVRIHDDHEFCFYSDEKPTAQTYHYADVRLDTAKMYCKAMRWLEQEARLLTH
ncbi:hypothetical protein [Desulfobulbus oligotrophicus]|jgi:hypothetical protein|uniref:Uncharacterized protein n=1 Tax=Desulfobulbus oligotrophicus TaxID=1909699 RepID=A0A7T5VE96_9BACT|nr:hypothetical protein [Desulfobulbus oligotrophicus]MDY0390212.1 hypothetical protein [Desulfobulbus oligotrophicus]QQG66289.1 hypothetical protein HP555_10660 [Desulfobulbus oligotrophicus]